MVICSQCSHLVVTSFHVPPWWGWPSTRVPRYCQATRMPQPISATQLAQGPGHWSGHTAACHTPTVQNLYGTWHRSCVANSSWSLLKKVCIIEHQKVSCRIIIKRMTTMMNSVYHRFISTYDISYKYEIIWCSLATSGVCYAPGGRLMLWICL